MVAHWRARWRGATWQQMGPAWRRPGPEGTSGGNRPHPLGPGVGKHPVAGGGANQRTLAGMKHRLRLQWLASSHLRSGWLCRPSAGRRFQRSPPVRRRIFSTKRGARVTCSWGIASSRRARLFVCGATVRLATHPAATGVISSRGSSRTGENFTFTVCSNGPVTVIGAPTIGGSVGNVATVRSAAQPD